jgi:regulator of chromosome condensation
MLTEDGDILTCGNAEQGQLGRVAEIFANRGGRKGLSAILLPEIVHMKRARGGGKVKFDNVWAGYFTTFAKVKDSTDIYAWGLNNYSQLGLKTGLNDLRIRYMPEKSTRFCGKDWIKICPGEHHTAALDSDGAVYVIGRCEYGRLGLGFEGHSHVDQLTQVTGLERCVDVSAATDNSFVATYTGKVYSWGAKSPQLGIGVEDDDEQSGEDRHQWTPVAMASKQLEPLKAVEVSGGGQHAVILAMDKGQ